MCVTWLADPVTVYDAATDTTLHVRPEDLLTHFQVRTPMRARVGQQPIRLTLALCLRSKTHCTSSTCARRRAKSAGSARAGARASTTATSSAGTRCCDSDARSCIAALYTSVCTTTIHLTCHLPLRHDAMPHALLLSSAVVLTYHFISPELVLALLPLDCDRSERPRP